MDVLLKSFKNLLDLEIKARDIYSEILQDINDKEISLKLGHIKDQEIIHILYAKKLVQIGKRAAQRKNKPKVDKETIGFLRQDIVFKKQLLNTTIQLLDFRIQAFALAKTDKFHEELIHTLAHQLKTPLTVTKWISGSLLNKKTGLTEKQKEMVGQVKIANESMFFLVDDLLESSRIEDSAEDLNFEKFDLVKLCKEIIRELSYLTEQKKQKIDFQVFEKEVVIISNKNTLQKIIHNFLTNAIQYGKKNILIKIKKDRKAGRILLSVSDDGIGIFKGEQKHIFEKFFRTPNAQKVHPKGTGLGLYIVKGLVEKIEGKIWFESPASSTKRSEEKGKGATFYISIPAK